jgi:DNA polymerase III sliding clamp (beta) subunit (PCNA family)
MKYHVRKDDLNRAAIAANKVASVCRTIPACAVVRVDARPGCLEFRTTDLATYRLERIAAERIDGRGSACAIVAARSLRDVVKAQSGKVLSVEISADSLAVGGVPVELSEVPAEDLPTWPDLEEPERAALDWPSFATAAAKVLPAISKEESRFQLAAALLEVSDDGKAELVATDGHRLHAATLETRGDTVQPVHTLIPREVISDLATSPRLRAMGGDLRPVLDLSPHHGRITCAAASGLGVVWLYRIPEGKFPDYERVIPAAAELPTAGAVDSAVWSRAIKALLPTVDGRAPAMRLVMTPNGCELSTGPDGFDPQASKDLPGTWTAPAAVVGLNPHYALDVLKAGATSAAFLDENSAALWTADGFRAVIMPIRLGESSEKLAELAEHVAARLNGGAVAKPVPAEIVAPAVAETATETKEPARKAPIRKAPARKAPARKAPARKASKPSKRKATGRTDRQRPKPQPSKRPAAVAAAAGDGRPARPVAVAGEAGDVLRWARGAGYAAEMRGAWVWVRFDGKPSAAVRDGLKAHRLRWAKRRSIRDRCSWWYYAPARPAAERQAA